MSARAHTWETEGDRRGEEEKEREAFDNVLAFCDSPVPVLQLPRILGTSLS